MHVICDVSFFGDERSEPAVVAACLSNAVHRFDIYSAGWRWNYSSSEDLRGETTPIFKYRRRCLLSVTSVTLHNESQNE